MKELKYTQMKQAERMINLELELVKTLCKTRKLILSFSYRASNANSLIFFFGFLQLESRREILRLKGSNGSF